MYRLRGNKPLFSIVILLLGVIAISISLFEHYLSTKNGHVAYSDVRGRDLSYEINTSVCKIIAHDPWDKSIRRFIKKMKRLICHQDENEILFTQSTILKFNKTALKLKYSNNSFSHCMYKGMSWADGNDIDVIYRNASKLFKDDVNITEDFIIVNCYNSSAGETEKKLFSFIQKKAIIERARDAKYTHYLKKYASAGKLNVLMIAIEGVSALNFRRNLPQTTNFLLSDLEAFEMHGYNKVGENTLPNLLPMISGKFCEDIMSEKAFRQIHLDNNLLIWSNYSEQGFRTLWADDYPAMSPFYNGRAGFRKPPTDYYLRPFYIALQKHYKRTDEDCLGNKQDTEIVLDYLNEFLKSYTEKPYFAFAFPSKLTHGRLNELRMADTIYYEFFKNAKERGYLQKTVIFFFSDHGKRIGRMLQYPIGKQESRLPGMFVVLPEMFQKRFPMATKNVLTNTRRLSTPFDVYDTLKHILLNKPNDIVRDTNSKGISLFNEIPENRTCKDAFISPQYCTCHKLTVLNVGDESARKAALHAVADINERTSEYRNVCQFLKLSELHSAEGLYLTDYHVDFSVTPGSGRFEAIVSFNSEMLKYKTLGNIIRINMYGNQSYCVESLILKNYCLCSVQ